MAKYLMRACLALICSAAVGTAVADDSFRCGSKIIVTGMTQAEVLQYCGEPVAKDVEDHDVRSGKQVVGRTAVWRWTYKFSNATRVLVFDQDTLKSIE
jgi:hypothetical protein